jgi:hypothetical protein
VASKWTLTVCFSVARETLVEWVRAQDHPPLPLESSHALAVNHSAIFSSFGAAGVGLQANLTLCKF